MSTMTYGEIADRLQSTRDIIKFIDHLTPAREAILGLRLRKLFQAEAALAAKDAEIDALKNALRPFADIADFMDSETSGFSMTDTLNLVTSDEHFPATIISTFCLQRFYTARELVKGGSDAC